MVKAALPVLDLRTAAWNAVKSFRLAIQVQVTAICQ